MSKIILVTGGFDPLHSGHLSMFKSASELGTLVVGLNSDEWLTRKKGMPFLNINERLKIINSLKDVSLCLEFDDSDGSAINAIKRTIEMYKNFDIVFANGGDRNSENIPEYEFCKSNNVEMIFGVGGENKQNSSSWILSNWIYQNLEKRIWGSFKTLYTNEEKVKVKELTILPSKSISLQRHQHRNEYWVVISGNAKVQINNKESFLKKDQSILIKPNTIHKLTNIGNDNLVVLEVQHGECCNEIDIERFEDKRKNDDYFLAV